MEPGDLTIYRGCTPVVDANYDAASERTPTEVIVEAIATAADVDPLDLPPLYESIDPDAVDQLVGDREGDEGTGALLSFTFDTWNVFVRSDGRIRVCDATKPTDPEPVFDTPAV